MQPRQTCPTCRYDVGAIFRGELAARGIYKPGPTAPRDLLALAELVPNVRHSGCGHVIAYRSMGGPIAHSPPLVRPERPSLIWLDEARWWKGSRRT